MKKEDLVEITLAMVSLDKHYQSLTSYALASEKKREKIDKAVAKLIKLIHHSDEYCVDHESAMFVINQLNKSKVDRLYRPNIYFMSNVSGGITEPPKEFNESQTEEVVPSNTSIDCIIDDKQLKLASRRYGFDFDEVVKTILNEANREKLSYVRFIGVCDTNDHADSTFSNRKIGTVLYVIESNDFKLKYDSITERCIHAKSTAPTKRADEELDPNLPVIDNIEDMEGDAEELHMDFDDLYAWVVYASILTTIKKFKYGGKVDTLSDLENKQSESIYYCNESKTMHVIYKDKETGAKCVIDYKNAPNDDSKTMTKYEIGNEMKLISLAKEYRLNFFDMMIWIRDTAVQKKYKSVSYMGKILTIENLNGKPKGEIYYCPVSRKLYMKYGTGRNSYIASPKF